MKNNEYMSKTEDPCFSICPRMLGNYRIPADPSSRLGEMNFQIFQVTTPRDTSDSSTNSDLGRKSWTTSWNMSDVTCHGFHMFSCDPPQKKRKKLFQYESLLGITRALLSGARITWCMAPFGRQTQRSGGVIEPLFLNVLLSSTIHTQMNSNQSFNYSWHMLFQ